jgi:hypothetical protein
MFYYYTWTDCKVRAAYQANFMANGALQLAARQTDRQTDRHVLLQTGCEPTTGNVLSVTNCNTMDLDLQHNYCLMTLLRTKLLAVVLGNNNWNKRHVPIVSLLCFLPCLQSSLIFISSFFSHMKVSFRIGPSCAQKFTTKKSCFSNIFDAATVP